MDYPDRRVVEVLHGGGFDYKGYEKIGQAAYQIKPEEVRKKEAVIPDTPVSRVYFIETRRKTDDGEPDKIPYDGLPQQGLELYILLYPEAAVAFILSHKVYKAVYHRQAEDRDKEKIAAGTRAAEDKKRQ